MISINTLTKDVASLKRSVKVLQASIHYTIPYSANISISEANGSSQEVTLTGNTTLAFTNISSGGFISIKVVQDSTGGRTVTLPGGTLTNGSIDTTASAVNAITIWRTGSQYLVTIGNYA
jgi:hypothetical protein